MRFSGYSGAGMLFFLVVGVLLGWWTAPGATHPGFVRNAGTEGTGPAAESLSAPDGMAETDRLGQGPRDLLEAALEGNEDDPRIDLLRLMARLSGDPSEVVGTVIDSMSEAELIASVTSFTDLSPEKFKESSEPKALARRLAELAMDGLLQRPQVGGAGLEAVYFSEGRAHGDLALSRAGSFGGEEPILATFPMGDYAGNEVFVKWTRVDDPKIMLFNHYPIRSDEEFNYVWLNPTGGWDAGEYEVNFYVADDSLTPLAGGRYVIDSKP
jgi:hypothetical protein